MGIDNRYCLVLLFIVFIAALVFLIIKYQKEIRHNSELQKKSGEFGDLSSGIEEYKEEIRKLISEIQEKKERGKNLRELAERCEEYRSKVITGMLEVDVLLSYKEKLCKERDVRISYEIAEIKRPILKEEEYLSLFGNLINNAIEAAERCDNKEISVRARTVKEYWILKVINTKPEKEHPIENGMATTKEDTKNHGIGSKVIDRIAKKNRGKIKRCDYGDTFEVTVLIPVNEI